LKKLLNILCIITYNILESEKMNIQKKIKELFKNSYTEVNRNHNEAVTAFRNYCSLTGSYIPVLASFDTHSDVYLNSKQISPNIANWVNFCFSKLGTVEYYWIIPHYIMQNDIYKKIFHTDNKNIHKETFLHGAMRAFGTLDDALKEDFFLDKKNSELISVKKLSIINEKNKKFGIEPFTPENTELIPVSISIVPFDKIGCLKNRNIALSVDADYFCNTGHDTVEAVNNRNISSDELNKEFELFINLLYENSVKIDTASLTRSPAYFPSKFEREINAFFAAVKAASKFKKAAA